MSLQEPLLRPSPARRRRLAVATALASLVVGLFGALLPSTPARAEGGGGETVTGVPFRWTPEIVDLARRIPVQDEGRIKPLDTVAQIALLRMNHKRAATDLEGNALEPIEWLLDVLFRPDRARRYACFTVENDGVLDAIGLSHEGKKKRDRYSFEDLSPGLPEALRLAHDLRDKEAKDLTAEETGVVALAHALQEFDGLLHFADYGRASLKVDGSPGLKALFPEGDRGASVIDVVAKAKELRALAGTTENPHGGGAPAGAPKDAAAAALRDTVLHLAEDATALAIIPPAVPREQAKEWFAPGHVLQALLLGDGADAEYVEMVGRFAGMAASARDPVEFGNDLRAFHATSSTLARNRGEYDKIGLEIFLYRLDPFYRALWLYGLAFLLLAFSWAAAVLSSSGAAAKWLRWAGWVPLLAAIALQVTGIVLRCVLLDRPPIKNLYDTVIFISTVGAIALVLAEWVTRRGIALAVAPIAGGLLQFVANRYEILEGKDTLHQMQAVLDTNFWLATHVVCINLGYCGGLMAAFLGHVHVLGRTTRLGSEGFYNSVTRLTYGMLGFGLFFSVVGTILGGVWADESWGRFWGWDPKENGALMICLAQLAVLHALTGKMLKPFGFAMANVAQGCVIAFSWWGVNLLGMGLHSYGFTGGVWTGLMTFYGVEALVLGAGATTWLLGRAYGPPSPPPPLPAAAASE